MISRIWSGCLWRIEFVERAGEFDFAVWGKGRLVGLSIMADIDHNCMKRCDSHEMCMASLLVCPGELAEAYGGMNGV